MSQPKAFSKAYNGNKQLSNKAHGFLGSWKQAVSVSIPRDDHTVILTQAQIHRLDLLYSIHQQNLDSDFFPPRETVVLSHQFIPQPVEIRARVFTHWDNKICYKTQTWKNHIFPNWVQLFLRLSPRDAYCLLGLNSLWEPLECAKSYLLLHIGHSETKCIENTFPTTPEGWLGECVEENEKSGKSKSKMLAGGSVNGEDFYSDSFFHLKIKRVLGIEIHPLSLQMNLDF